MPPLRLHEVIVYCQDMQRQLRFYRDQLGLRVTWPDLHDTEEELHWVTFDTGACTLALHSGGTTDKREGSPRFVFSVDDLPSVRKLMIAQGISVSDIRSPAPGVLVCDLNDPEGNVFSIESVSPPSSQ